MFRLSRQHWMMHGSADRTWDSLCQIFCQDSRLRIQKQLFQFLTRFPHIISDFQTFSIRFLLFFPFLLRCRPFSQQLRKFGPRPAIFFLRKCSILSFFQKYRRCFHPGCQIGVLLCQAFQFCCQKPRLLLGLLNFFAASPDCHDLLLRPRFVLLYPRQNRIHAGKIFFPFSFLKQLRFCLFLLCFQSVLLFRCRLQFFLLFQKLCLFLLHLLQQFQAFLFCADLLLQFFADGSLPFCPFAFLLFFRFLWNQSRQFLFLLCFFLPPLLALFYLAEQLGFLLHLCFHRFPLLLKIRKSFLIHLDATCQQFHPPHHLTVEICLFQLRKFLFEHRILRADDIVEILENTPPLFTIRIASLFRGIPQTILQLLINFRMKHFPENFTSICRFCQEKFLEIPLRDHGNLSKLLLIQSEKFRYSFCHFRTFRHRLSPIRKNQFCICSFSRHSLTALLRPIILRIPLYHIIFSLMRKGKLHKSAHFRRGILAAEHLPRPDFTACLAVERKGNRIKNCCFSCTGITCNQIQAAAAQFCKIQFCPVRIWSECTDNQFLWLHLFIPLSNAFTNAFCCSVMLWLFCSS